MKRSFLYFLDVVVGISFLAVARLGFIAGVGEAVLDDIFGRKRTAENEKNIMPGSLFLIPDREKNLCVTKVIGFLPDDTIFVKQFKTSFFSDEERTDEKENAPLGTNWDFEQINSPWFKRQN